MPWGVECGQVEEEAVEAALRDRSRHTARRGTRWSRPQKQSQGRGGSRGGAFNANRHRRSSLALRFIKSDLGVLRGSSGNLKDLPVAPEPNKVPSVKNPLFGGSAASATSSGRVGRLLSTLPTLDEVGPVPRRVTGSGQVEVAAAAMTRTTSWSPSSPQGSRLGNLTSSAGAAQWHRGSEEGFPLVVSELVSVPGAGSTSAPPGDPWARRVSGASGQAVERLATFLGPVPAGPRRVSRVAAMMKNMSTRRSIRMPGAEMVVYASNASLGPQLGAASHSDSESDSGVAAVE